MLKVPTYICVPRGSIFHGGCSLYFIHFNLLLPTDELFFTLLGVYYFSFKSAKPMSFDHVYWLDFKIIFLKTCHPIHMSFS